MIIDDQIDQIDYENFDTESVTNGTEIVYGPHFKILSVRVNSSFLYKICGRKSILQKMYHMRSYLIKWKRLGYCVNICESGHIVLCSSSRQLSNLIGSRLVRKFKYCPLIGPGHDSNSKEILDCFRNQEGLLPPIKKSLCVRVQFLKRNENRTRLNDN